MNRIKVELPDTFSFSTLIPLRITDLNHGGHVGNDRFLTIIHEARQQFLLSFGYGEMAIEGYGLIMTDAVIEFKKELHYGDTLKVSVAAGDFSRLGFDFYYLMEVITENGSYVAGKAKTAMLCYDFSLKKKVSLPEAIRRTLSGG
jgi:acyl-CoA thioester hydrolase